MFDISQKDRTKHFTIILNMCTYRYNAVGIKL